MHSPACAGISYTLAQPPQPVRDIVAQAIDKTEGIFFDSERIVFDERGEVHGIGKARLLVDGVPVLSCLALAAELAEAAIETVEGLQEGGLHPLQAAFADLGAAQCGYCTPGILMTAKALLAQNAEPTREEIRSALAGNLCRCTGYHKITEAVEWAAALARGDTGAAAPREAIYGAALPGET